MNYEILDELIAISKKSEASKQKKMKYFEQMEILLNEEGLSDTAVQYLKNGFGFAGAKPLAKYIKESGRDKRAEIISNVLASELFKCDNTVDAFKLGINLSAYSIIWLGDDQRLLYSLIKIIPSVSHNKENKLLKNAPKIFEKYFLDLINDDTAFPSLSENDIKEGFIREYRQMVISIVEKVSNKYSNKVEKIRAWIGATDYTGIGENKQKTNDSTDKKRTDIHEYEDQSNDPVKERPALPFNINDLGGTLAELSEFSSRISATISALNESKLSEIRLKEQTAELSRSLQYVKSQLDTERNKVQHQKEEIEYYKENLSHLKLKLNDSQKEINIRKDKIGELQDEINHLNSIISVFSADKQNSQSEQLNAIASKLKADYIDFKDVEKEEMTVDLGENLRCQLQSIFKILKKSGINVERR